MKGYITAFLILSLLVIGATYLKSFSRFEIYSNDANGYYFKHPRTLTVKEYEDSSVSVGIQNGEMFNSLVDIKVYRINDGDLSEPRAFIEEKMRNMCAADSTTQMVYCEGIEKVQPFLNARSMSGEVFYMRKVYENLETGEKEVESFGPNFVFNMGDENRFLVVQPSMSKRAVEVDNILMRTVADNISFLCLSTSHLFKSYV